MDIDKYKERSITILWTSLNIILPLCTAIFVKIIPTDPISKFLAPDGNYFNRNFVFFACICIINVIWVIILSISKDQLKNEQQKLEDELVDEREKRRDTELANENLKIYIGNLEELRLMDINTGISNNEKFKTDILIKYSKSNKKKQLIYISI